ncbi:hypothetical protein E4U17_001877 [Claviceps sp. LM77 group G4]|nr:hypothetical protein E4U17_001877 [Claviceps sp. LM77 group G4]KAG6083751.1 hypothetical protein E4U33_004464 [Claviceps sp. LM78 group G4]
MALLNHENLHSSSNYGEDTAARVNVLASCYVLDSAAQLKGLHYCTTGASESRGIEVDSWLEVWDYAGGASFRAFVTRQEQERSLFVFFDVEGALGRDLKKGLMAVIDLADGPLACSHVVTCIDRRMPVDNALELTKSLQWVGFEMTTLDHWAQDLDVTSDRWVFMGMEM